MLRARDIVCERRMCCYAQLFSGVLVARHTYGDIEEKLGMMIPVQTGVPCGADTTLKQMILESDSYRMDIVLHGYDFWGARGGDTCAPAVHSWPTTTRYWDLRDIDHDSRDLCVRFRLRPSEYGGPLYRDAYIHLHAILPNYEYGLRRHSLTQNPQDEYIDTRTDKVNGRLDLSFVSQSDTSPLYCATN